MVGIKDYKSSSYRYIDNERFIPIQRNFKNNCIKLSKVDSNKFMGGKRENKIGAWTLGGGGTRL